MNICDIVGVVILCRTSSKRLPNKIHLPLKGKTVLLNIYDHLLTTGFNEDNIIVATSDSQDDDSIELICKENKIRIYRGSLDNVADRFCQAAIALNREYTVRLNADNIYINTSLINNALEFINSEFELITNIPDRTFPKGISVEVIKSSTYYDAYDKFSTPDHFEHVTAYFYENTQDFNIKVIESPDLEYAGYQMALDTQRDYIIASKIYDNIDFSNFELEHVCSMHKSLSDSLPFTGKNGPLLIAEIGGNHEGDFNYAKQLTKMAIDTDVDYIKFQIYTGDTLVNKKISPDRHKHFNRFMLSKDQYLELADMVVSNGKKFMASIWDLELLNWIDHVNPVYKIGSGDLTAYNLVHELALRGKPIILSTGLSTFKEVESFEFIRTSNKAYNNKDKLAILQCTSMYPIPDYEANLAVLNNYRRFENVTVGYSDHTIGDDAIYAAICLGSEVVEFHLLTTDTIESLDHQVSLSPKEVDILVDKIRKFNSLVGTKNKTPTISEISSDHINSFRRAVYLKNNVEIDTVIQKEHLIALRPRVGIGAEYYYELIGKKAKKIFHHLAH